MKFGYLSLFIGLSACLLAAGTASAERLATPSLMGPLGLNTTPSARMDEPGTIRFGMGIMDPYVHGFLGFQVAEPLYIALRQTAVTTDIRGKADNLYPGMDLKLRLAEETALTPDIAVGLQSAFGHKRMAGEYLVATKRFGDFDVSGGLAWGRLGSAAHLSNPLNVLGSHFDKDRDLDGEDPNDFNDWFTGKDIGLFGGVEYFPPWSQKLSFKADYGADRYVREQAALGRDMPEPWSIGLNYRPKPWISLGSALVGGDTLMGTVSVQGPLSAWNVRQASYTAPPAMRPHRSGTVTPADMERNAVNYDMLLYNTKTDTHSASSFLAYRGNNPLPLDIGRAARLMANSGGMNIERLSLIPTHYGLRGPMISLMRDDLERAVILKQGSPEEIWQHTSFSPKIPENLYGSKWVQPFQESFLSALPESLTVTLDNRGSLSEDDHGILYRSSVIVEEKHQTGTHVLSGMALRFDLKNNLEHLTDYRMASLLPVRSNENDFANNRFSLDRMYISYLTTLKTDLHIGLTSGFLEEMYSGFGGEVLYRPFGRTFAVGANLWQVFKRNPDAFLEMGLNGDHVMTGHLNAWYEFPNTDLTLQIGAGRYLAQDLGGSVSLVKNMKNGIKLKAFVTATDNADIDVFGGTTHLYSGLQLTIPLGGWRVLPNGSKTVNTFAPLGRDMGQALDAPVSLYDLTEPFSLRQISQHWPSVVE